MNASLKILSVKQIQMTPDYIQITTIYQQDNLSPVTLANALCCGWTATVCKQQTLYLTRAVNQVNVVYINTTECHLLRS